MTRKQMRDQVMQWLGLQDIEDYNETQLADDLIYQGAIDLLARTRCAARCLHLQTQPDVATYELDHSVLGLLDVDDGRTRRARRDQAGLNPSFTMIRSDILQVKPTPSEAGELDVWAVLRPAQMTQDTDSPSLEQYGAIPDEYHDAIVLYALWKGADYSDDQQAANGDRYRVLYEGQDTRGGRLREIRMLVNKRGTTRAPARRVSLRYGSHTRDLWIG
jgi:hypothetical protein